MRKVEVVPHDSKWREAFQVESKRITAALGENVVAIHHIGSTAIPKIYAKPTVDLLVEVKDIVQVDEQSSSMESLGYEAMGEFGIPSRRFFRKLLISCTKLFYDVLTQCNAPKTAYSGALRLRLTHPTR